MADSFRDPDFERGNWRLPDAEWSAWKDDYLAGKKLPCKVCGFRVAVVLSPTRGIVSYACGHRMELPDRMDL